MGKKKKVRVDLRKNRNAKPRPNQWTRGFQDHGFAEEATTQDERVRSKGELSRKRTIMQDDATTAKGDEPAEMPGVAPTDVPGRVLRVFRDVCEVQTQDGRVMRCVVRWLLRSLSIDERSIVTTGDRVWVRPVEQTSGKAEGAPEGAVVRVEPRH